MIYTGRVDLTKDGDRLNSMSSLFPLSPSSLQMETDGAGLLASAPAD